MHPKDITPAARLQLARFLYFLATSDGSVVTKSKRAKSRTERKSRNAIKPEIRTPA